MRKIRIEIKASGSPYPNECWWRVKSSNGQLYVHSELMGKRNAKRVIAKIIAAIKSNKYDIVEVKEGNDRFFRDV